MAVIEVTGRSQTYLAAGTLQLGSQSQNLLHEFISLACKFLGDGLLRLAYILLLDRVSRPGHLLQ